MNERERMAEALIALCFENGYRQTTLEMLLERAGVERAAFERHFADMEDCFCKVYEDMQEELMRRVVAAIEREPTWRDRLRTSGKPISPSSRFARPAIAPCTSSASPTSASST
jgi:AcrR family transcriptional regulator